MRNPLPSFTRSFLKSYVLYRRRHIITFGEGTSFSTEGVLFWITFPGWSTIICLDVSLSQFMFLSDTRNLFYLFRRGWSSNHGQSSRRRRAKSYRITRRLLSPNHNIIRVENKKPIDSDKNPLVLKKEEINFIITVFCKTRPQEETWRKIGGKLGVEVSVPLQKPHPNLHARIGKCRFAATLALPSSFARHDPSCKLSVLRDPSSSQEKLLGGRHWWSWGESNWRPWWRAELERWRPWWREPRASLSHYYDGEHREHRSCLEVVSIQLQKPALKEQVKT